LYISRIATDISHIYAQYFIHNFILAHAVRIFTQSISAKILLVSKKVSNVVSRLVLTKNKWMNSKHLQMHTGLRISVVVQMQKVQCGVAVDTVGPELKTAWQ